MPGLTGHLSSVIPGLTFLVIPGLTRKLKTFKLKVKYFILLKNRNWFGYFSYTFAMDIEFKFMSIC